MAQRSDRLTVSQFAREVFDQRSPLYYAFAVVLGASRAGDAYAAGEGVPAALLVGGVLGAAILVLMCAVTWFVLRIRGA